MPVTNDREYRKIDCSQIETRAQEDGTMVVSGYATTFDSEYELFRMADFVLLERIDAHAFDNCDMSDVIMQYDHEGRVFARTKNNSLELSVDDHGLHIRANLGGTEIGRQLYQEIAGGYTNKMSFGFKVSGETRSEEQVDGVTYEHRVITAVSKLYDVSAVSLPANDATEISARNLCEGAIARIMEERHAEEERKRKIQRIKLMIEVNKR